jgi:serine/threonine protein kinase
MATVYKAYQESLDRYVAVKVLLSNRDPQFAARFKREARAIAALQHHNILPIYDSGEQNSLLYFVMQYVDTGVTLHDMLGRPLAPIEALRLIAHVLNALEYAHTRGVVHRDIKPANILMPSPTWALLADFGIAKLLNDSQHLTMTGFIIGTAAYMAPEQASGKPIDARTDLYSIGIVLYEMLTGRVPFDAETPMAMLTKHVYEPPPPPRVLNPALSPLLETVLLRALEKNPNDRYQSASEMGTDLEHVALHLGRPRPSSQVTSLYQAGVEAFEQGRYDEASERLARLIALDPSYEDATILLKAAQAAQARATQQGEAAPTSTPPSTSDQTIADTPLLAATVGQTLKAAPITGKMGDKSSNASVEIAHAGSTPATRADSAQTVPNTQATTSKPAWQRWAIVAGVLLLLLSGGAGSAWSWSRRTAANSALVLPLAGTTASTTPTSTSTLAVSPTTTSTPTPPPSATATAQPTATPQPTDTPRPPDALVTNAQQRLRSGPGQNYANLRTYTQGATFSVTGKDPSGEWIQVTAPDGQIGWMLAADLQLNRALSDIPTVEAPPSPTPPPTPKPTRRPAPKPTAQPAQPAQPTSPPPPPPTAAEPQPTPVPPTNTPEPPTNTPAPQHHDPPPKPKFTPRP